MLVYCIQWNINHKLKDCFNHKMAGLSRSFSLPFQHAYHTTTHVWIQQDLSLGLWFFLSRNQAVKWLWIHITLFTKLTSKNISLNTLLASWLTCCWLTNSNNGLVWCIDQIICNLCFSVDGEKLYHGYAIAAGSSKRSAKLAKEQCNEGCPCGTNEGQPNDIHALCTAMLRANDVQEALLAAYVSVFLVYFLGLHLTVVWWWPPFRPALISDPTC